MAGRTLTELCAALLLLLVVRVRGDGGIDPAALAGAVGVEVYDFDKKLNECNEETTFSCDDFFEMLKGYGQKMVHCRIKVLHSCLHIFELFF